MSSLEDRAAAAMTASRLNSLEATDAASRAVVRSPNTRVSLADIEAAIQCEHTFIAGDAVRALGDVGRAPLNTLTLCIITMRNGFTVVGKAAPADPGNFNAELGRQFAREDAIRQLWPLMGFALRDRLAALNPATDAGF